MSAWLGWTCRSSRLAKGRTTGGFSENHRGQLLFRQLPSRRSAQREDARARTGREWELVKAAKPRFPGHQQPKVPLWGYTDESDPKVMAQKIAAAADHGIDAFIFDWYYYNDGPFLDRPIDIGFLKADEQPPPQVRLHVGEPRLAWRSIPTSAARRRRCCIPAR